MEADEILRILPHRYPFLIVDRVLELEPKKRAVAVLRITSNGPYVAQASGGRFPEVLVIEALAQVGAITAAAGPQDGNGPDTVSGPAVMGYLAGLNDVVFSVYPKVGDDLVLTLRYVARLGSMVRFEGLAEIDGVEALRCGLTFTVEVSG